MLLLKVKEIGLWVVRIAWIIFVAYTSDKNIAINTAYKKIEFVSGSWSALQQDHSHQNPALSEDFCHSATHMNTFGKVVEWNSIVLRQNCVDHCPTKNCPHREEILVEALWNNYLSSKDGIPEKEIEILQQCANPQQLASRETPISSNKRHPRIVFRTSKKQWAGQKELLAIERERRAVGGARRAGWESNVQSQSRLSPRSIVGTRSASHAWYTGMQWRKWDSARRIRFLK